MKIKQKILWSILDYGAVPIGMIVSTPILTQQLGLDRFGVLVLVTALIAFSAVFNFGFGDTALKFVSQYMQANERPHALGVVQTIVSLALASGLVVAASFVAAAQSVAGWLGVSTVSGALDALLLTGVLMALKMIESVYIASLRGCDRYDLAGRVTVIAKLTTIALQTSLAVNGYGLPGMMWVSIAVSTISIMLLFLSLSRVLGFTFPKYSNSAFAEIREFSGWSWMQGIAGLVYANIDRIVISAMLGPTALGIYGISIQLAQNIHYALSAAAHFLFPMISRFGSDNSIARSGEVREIFVSASRKLSVISVVLGTVGAVFSYEILDVWIGADIAQQGSLVLSLLCISYSWFAANSIVSYYTLNGLGMVHIQAGVSVTGGLIMGATSLLLIPIFGLIGAGAARIPDSLFRLGVRTYIARRVIGNISYWVGLDFLRISLIVWVVCHYVREALILKINVENLLLNPVSLLVIVCTTLSLMYVTNRIEFFIAQNDDNAKGRTT